MDRKQILQADKVKIQAQKCVIRLYRQYIRITFCQVIKKQSRQISLPALFIGITFYKSNTITLQIKNEKCCCLP